MQQKQQKHARSHVGESSTVGMEVWGGGGGFSLAHVFGPGTIDPSARPRAGQRRAHHHRPCGLGDAQTDSKTIIYPVSPYNCRWMRKSGCSSSSRLIPSLFRTHYFVPHIQNPHALIPLLWTTGRSSDGGCSRRSSRRPAVGIVAVLNGRHNYGCCNGR